MPTPTGVGSENLANPMFTALVGAGNDVLPVVDIWDSSHGVTWDPTDPTYAPSPKVTVPELVACVEALQVSFKTALEEQADKQRITNADYAKTYLGMYQVTVQSAVQFMLGKDQAFWLALKARSDAANAVMENEKLKMEVMLLRAQFAKTKLELAATDSQFGVNEVQRTQLVPAQVDLTREQFESARAQTLDTRSDTSPVAGLIGGQKVLTTEQVRLVHEQMEGQRAQTLDARQDGTVRTQTVINPDGSEETRLQGLLGVQNFLYRQQITSYREDSRVKAGKLFSDLWMTMKTMDDGIEVPTYFRPPRYDPTSGAVLQTTPYEDIFKSIRKIALGNEPNTFVP